MSGKPFEPWPTRRRVDDAADEELLSIACIAGRQLRRDEAIRLAHALVQVLGPDLDDAAHRANVRKILALMVMEGMMP
jgi:hypothetical protein